MTSNDPVYHTLKMMEQEQKPEFRQIGMDPRDFRTVLKHIHEAGYADASGLTPAGQEYIQAYERRLRPTPRVTRRDLA
ncbi:hypothetical protein [Paenibacillus jilunlii]|uniref:Uncharacterized protein n=1 Tax=Paenibacillus jilunlii TaxID=682956 RepID=A0A1G9S3H7_9BACL|nr:hypothetical protein [Paenibacillus jilunlii]KWX77752.1 hypothetical protein AML91_06920 [Paenibacillus jilunlii]SDM30036.1 hypothetical protein SAMN05216191_11138 [Paenibacillus jilunlii]